MRLSSGVRNGLAEAATWLMAAVVGVGTFIWFDDIRSSVALALGKPGMDEIAVSEPETTDPTPSGSVALYAASRGRFVTVAHINGRPVDVLVDTGATMVALSHEDAERAGIFVRPSDYTQRVRTANGTARIAPVILASVSIGDIELRDVEAAVGEPGRLGTTLLGMTFIKRLGRAEMRSGVLILQE